MATESPSRVVTLSSDNGVDQLLSRAIRTIDALGLEVFAVVDHSGDAADAGVAIPDSKLVLFGSPRQSAELLAEHPYLALDLPLKLLIWNGREQAHLSYHSPDVLAERHGLSDPETFRVVETVAHTARSES
jgi:uncharacterized protein (DUF302 family)